MIDLSKFETIDKDDGVAVYQRKVETPMPEGQTETNFLTAYRAGRNIYKVSKVTDRGWSVTAYLEGDDGIELDTILNQQMNAQAAQRLARQTAIDSI